MKNFILAVLLFVSTIVTSQRYTVLSGDLKNLKGIANYNVTFDYSNLKVNGLDNEEAFLKEKMANRQKHKGKAEQYKEYWYSDRESKYEPKFIDYFNKRFEKGEITVAKDGDVMYTMNIKTLWVYTGYNVVAAIEPAKITAIVTVVETSNPSHVLFAIEFDKSIGLAQGEFEFDQGYRIAGAYEKLAKNIVMQLKRLL